MGNRTSVRSRSGFHRGRRFRSSRRGVVAVVGTLLALLVFFALFGVFLTQYVPLWMEENESQLSNSIQTSLSTLRSGVDDQYLFGGIPTYSVPFTLNSQSVPLLSQPTIATMSYISGCPGGFYATNGTPHEISACDFQRLTFTTTPGGAGSQNHPFSQELPTDYLELSLPDRYFPSVTYFFEMDGLAQAQSNSHQSMLVPPVFNVTKTGSSVSVITSLLYLIGTSTTFSGQGSKDVTSTLVTVSNASSAGRFLTSSGAPRTFNLTLTLGVHEVCAWYNYLYNMTLSALGPSSGTTWTLTGAQSSGALALPPSLPTCVNAVSTTDDLTLEVFGVSTAYAFIAQDSLSFNAGGL
jgi:hypothetical protein